MGWGDLDCRRRRWAGAQGAVGPDLVVLPAAALDEDLGFGAGREDLGVEALVAELGRTVRSVTLRDS